MLYETHRRTSDNTIAKTNKDKQCYTKHIEELQTIPWPKCLTFFYVFCITLFVLVGFGHGIFWRSSMCFVQHCLYLLVLAMVLRNTSKKVRQYHSQNQQGQTMLCKTHWRTSDNTMAKTNEDKQCYAKHRPWYCLTFFDVLCVTLLVLVGFGHGIVWLSSMCFA
jgi:hypothetical protein